jgi:hypothetical protein
MRLFANRVCLRILRTTDVVPVQPTNICDIGLAALGRFGHKDVNVVQKASTFFSAILDFAVQKSCTHKNPAKTKGEIDHSPSELCFFFCVKAPASGFCAQFHTTNQARFGGTT